MPTPFNPETHTVGLDSALRATLLTARPDPQVAMNGMTFGIATMKENSPHRGEMHPDGDEVLYLISGRARVYLETEPPEECVMEPGDGLIVPKGIWHRVDIIQPCQIVYLTPGPNNQFRPL